MVLNKNFFSSVISNSSLFKYNKFLNLFFKYYVVPYQIIIIPLIILFFLLSTCKKEPVNKLQFYKVTIDPAALNIAKSDVVLYGLSVKVDGAPIQPADVKWSSDNDKVATVNDKGYVTGKGAGEATIIAELTSGKGSVKCKVTVYDEYAYKFRLVLKDKGTSGLSLAAPEKFLSARTIARRKKRNIAITDNDLPISADYISQIKKIGGVVVAQSKWLNTVSVHCENGLLAEEYKNLPFVKEVITVWQGKKSSSIIDSYQDAPRQKSNTGTAVTATDSSYYGTAWNNIHLNNGEVLHQHGFKGEGVEVAVIDAGFKGLKTNLSLGNINIKGAKSFIYENANPYDTDNHGVWVTSCMATDKPGYYVGTAPNASYWLLRTEDESSEYAVEEDYWVSAIEFADSAGVDVVNTSLSYSQFSGLTNTSYKYEDMNGKTAFASRAAAVAAGKGIFIVCCAGNDQSWVGTPGEAPDVLTVGSINQTRMIDNFTSFGITTDGRMKPDVVALGGGASVIDVTGNFMYRSGTSYASPIICGLAVCLWQAYPKLDNKDLLSIFRKASERYLNPVVPYGYGIPDMHKAILLATAVSASK